jgi:hypothetical protein
MRYKIALLPCSLGGSLVLGVSSYGAVPVKPITFPLSSSLIAQSAAPLTPAILKNATYQIPERGAVTLTNGTYQARSGDPLSVALSDRMAFGDLNGDGSQDAAVILAVNSGGTGVFEYLVVVSDKDNKPQEIASVLLGDRVNIQNLSINKAKIRVKMLKHSPTDPLCCPSEALIQSYRLDLKTNELVVTSLDEEEKNPDQPQVEDVPAPPLGTGDNVPDQPPEGEIEFKF